MAIKGITYDNQGPSAASHGALFGAVHGDGILSGCGISYLGADVTIGAGHIVSAGRLSRLDTSERITIDVTKGVARIVYQTDLSQAASRTEFKQLSFVVQTADSVAALPALIKENVNTGGVIYQMEFCVLQLGATGVESIISSAPRSRLAANVQYDPIKIITGVSEYEITAADIGTTLRSGWNEKITFRIAQKNSTSIPVGTAIAILTYGNADNILTISFDDVRLARKGKRVYPLGTSISIPDSFDIIALKKILNDSSGVDGDMWLVIGDVEVVS